MKRQGGQRLLGSGYAQALRVFADQPSTWIAVAERLNISRRTAQGLCHGFRRQGLIHIRKWERVKFAARHYLTPVYALGEGEDAPNPFYVRESKARTPAELLAFCDLIHALQEGTWHAKGLARHFGCGHGATLRTIRTLRSLSLIRIEEYRPRRGGGPGIALYSWGPDKKDAPRPPKLTQQELNQRHNKVAYARTKQIKLLHAMVRGVSVSGRKSDVREAA